MHLQQCVEKRQDRNQSMKLLCVLLSFVLVVTGCGRDSSETKPEAADTAPEPPPGAQQRSNLDVVIGGVTGRDAVQHYKRSKETLDKIRQDRARDMRDLLGE